MRSPTSDDVIVLAGDLNYLPHMKATAVNCRLHGGWAGDICFVLGADAHGEQADLERRGIYTVLSDRVSYYTKFALFRPCFRQWHRAFYTDSDVLVQRDLAPLFALRFDTALMMDREPFTFRHAFTYWDRGAALAANPELTRFLWYKRDPEAFSFCSANILWKPHELPDDVEKKLTELEALLKPINTHNGRGTDQSIMNVLLHERVTPFPDKLVCYWGVNKDGAPPTVLVHYVGFYAPWLPKPPSDESFINPVIGEPTFVTYFKMLQSFPIIFP